MKTVLRTQHTAKAVLAVGLRAGKRGHSAFFPQRRPAKFFHRLRISAPSTGNISISDNQCHQWLKIRSEIFALIRVHLRFQKSFSVSISDHK
jgi:hypothetical protein